jgi:hypothetical protein
MRSLRSMSSLWRKSRPNDRPGGDGHRLATAAAGQPSERGRRDSREQDPAEAPIPGHGL